MVASAFMAEKRVKPSEEELEFLEAYRPADFPRPSVAVDLVVLTIDDCDLKLLTVQRSEHPFKGKWALPGGFVRVGPSRSEQGEGVEEAAKRELAEETGLPEGTVFLDQLRTFGAPNRDPRMRVISVAYYALVRPTLAPLVRPGGDVRKVRWQSVADGLGLAFDHDRIVEVALHRVRDEIDRSQIAFELVPETFTIQQLRAVHEVVKGVPIDPGNFRKRFLRMIDDGVIEHARGKRLTTSKPAQVYRFKSRD